MLPFVTLTYAQAIDGSLAGPLGAAGPRLILSGSRSMALTHALRAAHQAILIGVGTLKADDPKLTVRLLPGSSPMRVIMDSKLVSPVDAKALQRTPQEVAAFNAGTLRRPHAAIVTVATALLDPTIAAKAESLERAGVRVLAVPADAYGHACLPSALSMLRSSLDVQSVMVEGGPAVIASCTLALLANRVIVTLAPKMLVNGLRPMVKSAATADAPASVATDALRNVSAFCLGDDVVMSALGPAAHEIDQL